MTTTTIATGSAWGIFVDSGAFGFCYDGIDRQAVGRWIVARFHELCTAAGRSDVCWTPRASEVIAEIDRPELDCDALLEQATREADELACSEEPPAGWYATVAAYTVSFRDESGESHDVHGDSLEDISRGLEAAGYTGSHLRVVTESGDTVGFVSATDWQPARA